MADLTLAAPIIVRASISKAEVLRADDAGSAESGKVRQLITVAVTTALRAPDAVPAQLRYIWDGPVDTKGRAVKMRGADVLLFVRPVEAAPAGDGKTSQVQLISAIAQHGASADDEAAVRALLSENASGKVPIITAVAGAFRVPGSVPGEAESQFFLSTAGGKPVSMVLLTRPGEPQRLTLALGDVIDDAAAPVRQQTLLWYRLACFLPAHLPAPHDDAALVADYAAALALLGPCGRTTG